jgi:hypothetical protein
MPPGSSIIPEYPLDSKRKPMAKMSPNTAVKVVEGKLANTEQVADEAAEERKLLAIEQKKLAKQIQQMQAMIPTILKHRKNDDTNMQAKIVPPQPMPPTDLDMWAEYMAFVKQKQNNAEKTQDQNTMQTEEEPSQPKNTRRRLLVEGQNDRVNVEESDEDMDADSQPEGDVGTTELGETGSTRPVRGAAATGQEKRRSSEIDEQYGVGSTPEKVINSKDVVKGKAKMGSMTLEEVAAKVAEDIAIGGEPKPQRKRAPRNREKASSSGVEEEVAHAHDDATQIDATQIVLTEEDRDLFNECLVAKSAGQVKEILKGLVEVVPGVIAKLFEEFLPGKEQGMTAEQVEALAKVMWSKKAQMIKCVKKMQGKDH